ncbi:hypothetical protein [Salipiger abyssi]|uniref:hypothetical protein n=1 Tax=Salipiger abyssi TaxID=1250539 RepID=UPI004059E211
MSRPSARYRRDQDAPRSRDPKVVLFAFSHPDLDRPIRLSSAPSEILTRTPRVYGTRSTWGGADPAREPFLFVACGVTLPGDQPDAPAAVTLTFDLFDATLPALLRSFATRATCRVAIVLESDPDLIEQQWGGLEVTAARIGDQIAISASRKRIEEEAAPSMRFTRTLFPGLHR